MKPVEHVDVMIVGGSLAGLQAALTLGRAMRSVVVVDDARPRNAVARHVHNFLAISNTAPAELLAKAKSLLTEYDVRLHEGRVEAVRTDPLEVQSWRPRALLLATGLKDELPQVPGVAELWGRDVVACPHCHGWEVRGESLGLLGLRGMPERAVQRALLVSRWSSDVTLYTDSDELTAGQNRRLSTAGVAVCTQRVAELDRDGDRLRGVTLADGTRQALRTLFVVTRQHQQSDLARRLGCAHTDSGAVETDAAGQTSVPGVWAAGTTTDPALLAIGAAGHASTVAVALHNALIDDDLDKGGRRIPA